MQEPTIKAQDLKTRRSAAGSSAAANPIHVVDSSRLAASSSAATLREAHMSLVRAEQNLYNLVQASHGAAGVPIVAPSFASSAQFGSPTPFGSPSQLGPAGLFGVSTPYGSSGLAYGAPAYAPGFAPASTIGTPGIGFGINAPVTPWGAMLQSGITNGVTPGITNGLTPSTWVPSPASTPWVGQSTPWSNAAAWSGNPAAIGLAMARSTPACDVSDEGKQFVCQLDLPGLSADHIEVVALERAVIINAWRESEVELASVVQSERAAAPIQRTVTLPNDIQASGVKASLSNGVLTIILPKVNPTEGPRRIKVQG